MYSCNRWCVSAKRFIIKTALASLMMGGSTLVAGACTVTSSYQSVTTTGSYGHSASDISCDVFILWTIVNTPYILQSTGGTGYKGEDHSDANHFGTYGQTGGNGGNMSLTFSATDTIYANGLNLPSGASLFSLVSTAGKGGTGGTGRTYSYGRNGGAGGRGGDITSSVAGTLLASGDDVNVVYALSQGGYGGTGFGGTEKKMFYKHWGSGGDGGAGGTITITSTASMTADGHLATGIRALSQGGDGGQPGYISGDHNGGSGGNGGDGGTVSVTNSGTMTITGHSGAGIRAFSFGGDGNDGHNEAGEYHYGGYGGDGGNGGSVTVVNSGDISSSGDKPRGIDALSTGGEAGTGGTGHVGGYGGTGGSAGTVSVTNSATISITGDDGAAIFARSMGYSGNDGGEGHPASDGRSGGDGGEVSVENQGDLIVSGDDAYGIFAQSLGGNGGDGGHGEGKSYAGDGGNGGHAGNVSVTNSGSITTSGTGGFGIKAISEGGTAGDGGSGHHGGDGGDGGSTGGSKGEISVTNSGTIQTSGTAADGIVAISNPGIGGNGGVRSGEGGDGGDAGLIDITVNNTIETSGIFSSGVFATSIGGNGEDGGSDKVGSSSAHGGDGGSAGHGGDVSFNASGPASGTVLDSQTFNILTTGDLSAGVHMQSIGGNGGRGGDAEASGFFSAVAVGGDGGPGGNAGHLDAELSDSAIIKTTGNWSDGLVLQSIGGGGGMAGSASASSLLDSTAVGGQGGNGGDGGTIQVEMHNSAILTQGNNSTAVLAQSIGGGGGAGGQAFASATGYGLSSATAIGGKGGSGGDGDHVYIVNGSGNNIVTGLADDALAGTNSVGIIAQSIGGGGGNGGSAASVSLSVGVGTPSFSNSVAIGGAGGSGGRGGSITVANDGAIQTYGANASGILAQSIGGGGGNGGDAKSLNASISEDASITRTKTVGGSGGDGGHSDTVELAMSGSIATAGDNAAGAILQSIGGGGGNGGSAGAITLTGSAGTSLSDTHIVGGSGGSGGDGGQITVKAYESGGSNATITTSGENASGLILQSIGGGGGNGGDATNLAISAAADATISRHLTVGGTGGDGGHGDDIVMTSNNFGPEQIDIQTAGSNAHGILAQSIGGGGGNGGDSLSIAGAFTDGGESYQLSSTVGGKGGAGGRAGTISIENAGSIITTGDAAYGMLVQSVGGGGGNGGNSTSMAISTEKGDINADQTIGGSEAIGGDGGVDGKTNSVTNYGTITTTGNRSSGIVAQSIGGGGGNGGHVTSFDLTVPSGDDEEGSEEGEGGEEEGSESDPIMDSLKGQVLEAAGLSGTTLLGGSGGAGGDGMTVVITNENGISTSGYNAHGMVAQSIGGGGGTAGTVTSFSADLTQDPSSYADDRVAGAFRTIKLSQSHGALAGANGSGGFATIAAKAGSITQTTGDLSIGMLAQTIGGGGGDGGFIEAADATLNEDDLPDTWTALTSHYDLTSRLGTSESFLLFVDIIPGGRVRGDAKAYVEDGAIVVSHGTASLGVVTQAIGNGGGTYSSGIFSRYLAGEGSEYKATYSLGTAATDSAGHGAISELVVSDATSHITTNGDLSHGALVQSIGGGGGLVSSVIGDTVSFSSQNLEFILGSEVKLDKDENYGAKAEATLNDGAITTSGTFSSGVVAQSIGGGGGQALAQLGQVDSTTTSLTARLGRNNVVGGFSSEARIANHATISSSGDGSHGLVAQSIGGGGGMVSVTNLASAAVATPYIFYGSSKSPSSANGETASIANWGDITTTGQQSYGILAQSIGGGGGLVSLDAGDSVHLHSYVSDQSAGTAYVNLVDGASITTHGDGSHGIFAQSSTSGGLLNLLGDTTITDYTAQSSSGYDKNDDSGHGGTVEIYADGTIATTGAYAHGIFAASTAGSTILSQTSDGLAIYGNHGLANSGAVSIEQSGSIVVSGEGSVGLYALANNWNTDDSIKVTSNGAISASGEGGAAIRLRNVPRDATSGSGGNGAHTTTSLDIQSDATILALDSSTATSAIEAVDDHGRFTIDVAGTVEAVEADGSSAQTYDAKQHAIKTSGYGTITVEDGGLVRGMITAEEAGRLVLHNKGDIDGAASKLAVYDSYSGSRHFLEIDPGAATGAMIDADHINVLEGTFNPYLSSFSSFSGDVTIVDLAKAPSGSLLDHVVDTPVLTFSKQLSDSGREVVLTGVTASFLDAGLTGNSLTIAQTMDAKVQDWMQGGTIDDQSLYDFLLFTAKQTSTEAVSDMLTDSLDATKHFGQTIGQHDNGVAHLSNLHSCGTSEGSYAAISEAECNWFKVNHNTSLDFSGGRTANTTGLSLGHQVAFGDVWRLGIGANVNFNDMSSTTLSSSGTSYHAGGVVKYTDGPWLATAGLSASYSTASSSRIVPTGARALSDQNAFGLSARLRAGRELELRPLFLMPLLDLDMSWIHDFGYEETGGGAFNIKVEEDNHFLFDLHPHIRFGTAFKSEEANATIRPYMDAGVRFGLNDNTLTQSFTSSAISNATQKMTIDRDDMQATLGAGFQAFIGDSLEAKVEYEGRFSDEGRGHAVSMKLGWSF